MAPRELSEAESSPLRAPTPPPRRGSATPELGIKCVLVGDGAVGKSSLIVSYTCNGYPARYRPTALDTFSGTFNGPGGRVAGGRLCTCGLGPAPRREGKEAPGEGGGSRPRGGAGEGSGAQDALLIEAILRPAPAVQVLVDGAPVRIELWDTAGQEDFDRLRSLCYPDTDVFLACFSVVQPSSFQNITEKWLPEIRTHNPQAPVLLVGTQADLRDDVNVLIELDQGGREGPVPQPQAQGLAEKIRACCYLECSALTQKNLKEVFDSAILSAIEHKARLEKKLNAKGVRTLSRCRWKKFFCFV
uniref:Ras homolog family member V n=1 Tax=Equus asinus TaxID=9793 RepID=A0A9L0JY85_EQUAS